jgi:putative colanic acid biosynthesis glycosyltransferase
MTINPLFSIITVSKDNKAGFQQTRESVKLQSFNKFEWIIIDGGSTDGTLDELDKERGWVSEPDQGPYDAMNNGMAKAKGDYLLFLNAGDTLAGPHVLEQIAAAIRAQKTLPEFIYGDSLELDFYRTARAPTQQNRGMFTHHQAMLYRREALKGLRYDLSYKIAADYDFTCRFVRSITHILYCPLAICVFETGGMSQQFAQLGRREQYAIRRKLGVTKRENNLIYAAQSVIWTARRLAPRLYWKIRSSCNSHTGFSRT